MSPVVERILEEVRSLTAAEQRQLKEVLDQIVRATPGPAGSADMVFGKYAHLPTSSREFCERKTEELELEDRRFNR